MVCADDEPSVPEGVINATDSRTEDESSPRLGNDPRPPSRFAPAYVFRVSPSDVNLFRVAAAVSAAPGWFPSGAAETAAATQNSPENQPSETRNTYAAPAGDSPPRSAGGSAHTVREAVRRLSWAAAVLAAVWAGGSLTKGDVSTRGQPGFTHRNHGKCQYIEGNVTITGAFPPALSSTSRRGESLRVCLKSPKGAKVHSPGRQPREPRRRPLPPSPEPRRGDRRSGEHRREDFGRRSRFPGLTPRAIHFRPFGAFETDSKFE